MDHYTAVRTFVRVAETGSFTKASDALELPRNTFAKLDQALEAHLQVKLLNRTTRQVSLTGGQAAYFEWTFPFWTRRQGVKTRRLSELSRRLRAELRKSKCFDAGMQSVPRQCALFGGECGCISRA